MEVCLNLSHSPGLLKRRDGGTVAVTMAVCSRTHRSQPVRERHERAKLADSHWLIKQSPPEPFCGFLCMYPWFSLRVSVSQMLSQPEATCDLCTAKVRHCFLIGLRQICPEAIFSTSYMSVFLVTVFLSLHPSLSVILGGFFLLVRHQLSSITYTLPQLSQLRFRERDWIIRSQEVRV